MHSGISVEMLSPWKEGGVCDAQRLSAVLTDESLGEALQGTDFSGLPMASTCEDPVDVW